MCPGYKVLQNVNISFEICVNVFQLIQNFNIPLEIYVNGSVDIENGALAKGANLFYIPVVDSPASRMGRADYDDMQVAL